MSRARSVLGFSVGVILLLSSIAPAAAESAPSPPVLLSPSANATGLGTSSTLSARFDDSEGRQLSAEFHLRKVSPGTQASDDFTIVALPDTQNYSSANANMPHFRAQTNWIVSSKKQLNTVLVAHLGDVVGEPGVEYQFQRAAEAMGILTSGKVPWTVLPGNHDMDVPTGEAILYDKYFPLSKFTGWTEPGVSFGGYYGQNQFGRDAANRLLKNSYVRIDRGSVRLLVLNLEHHAPDGVLDWAKRVIDAHPDRQVLLVTHNMIHVNGDFSNAVPRPGGNTPQEIFEKLVAPKCQIFMVINGHNTQGTSGEANSTKKNSCGDDVSLALSNYQNRTQGGQGWLRYYTFKPSEKRIEARTYSPSLKALETDADSQFDLPFDAPLPSNFQQVHKTELAAGGTATTPKLNLDANSTYEWYATSTVGSTHAKSQVRTFSTGSDVVPAQVSLVLDTFTRKRSKGWGKGNRGGVWQHGSGKNSFSVNGSEGKVLVPKKKSRFALLDGVKSSKSDVTATVRLDRLASGNGTYAEVWARANGNAKGISHGYRARIVFASNKTVRLDLDSVRNGKAKTLARKRVGGIKHKAGTRYKVRVQAVGTSPTTIRAKIWLAKDPEPKNWFYQKVDSRSGLQVHGGVGFRWGGSANKSQAFRIDNLVVREVR